jgi:hypothetical protein
MELKTEVIAHDGYRTVHVMTHASHLPDDVGRFAMALIERWGLVAAMPDGEDSSGRAKLALLPVEEMIERAVGTAETAYRVLAERGHLIEVPEYEKLREMAREERGKN